MAVIILNVTEKNGGKYGEGIQKYELKINDRLLCVFEHDYRDGLSSCLRKAAETFDRELIAFVKSR